MLVKKYLLKKRIQSQGLGLALGGGAVRGFFHIGVLQALEEYNIKISHISGISIGSLIGGLYASGYNAQETLNILTEQVQFRNLVTSATPTFFNKNGLFSGKKMIKQINDLVNFKQIQDLEIPFSCRSVDLFHFTEVNYTQGDLGEAIKASCAIPGVFTPEENEYSSVLVDGGVLGSVPLKLVKKNFKGPILSSNLISYDNLGEIEAQELMESFSENIILKMLPITENLLRSFYLMQSYITCLELEKYKPDIDIKFNGTYYPNITNIQESIDSLVTDGYQDTIAKLKQIGF